MFNVNREFRVVFVPYNPEKYNGRRRFAIGGGSIWKYIGEENAATAIEKAFNCPDDSFTKKFRKHGKIIFYTK